MKQRTLVVVSAGLGQPSATRLLADQLDGAARDALDHLGVRVDSSIIELRDYGHELVNNLLNGFPSRQLKPVVEAVRGADGLIAVTPIFSASYSGLFKMFFDVLDDDALVDKPVLIAATGGTARHSLALEHALRPMFSYLRAVVVPTSVYAAAEDWAGGAAEFAPRARIQRAAGELAELVSRREPTTAADPFALSTSFDQLLTGDGTDGHPRVRRPTAAGE